MSLANFAEMQALKARATKLEQQLAEALVRITALEAKKAKPETKAA